jgi:hypothetical protein
MKRILVGSIILVFGIGCATEADQAQWNQAMKDLRGDNMKMRTANWGKADSNDDSMLELPSRTRPSQN